MCPFHAATGLWCPLCGGLRMSNALIQGDLGAAFALNPLLVVTLGAASVLWLSDRVLGRTRLWNLIRSARAQRIGAVVLAVFTLARNLPGFTWLGPQ